LPHAMAQAPSEHFNAYFSYSINLGVNLLLLMPLPDFYCDFFIIHFPLSIIN